MPDTVTIHDASAQVHLLAGYFVGLPFDPRRDPVHLSPDYPTLAEAVAMRDRLRLHFPDCEIFMAVP